MTQDEARQAAHLLLGPSKKCGGRDPDGGPTDCNALCLRLQVNELAHANGLAEILEKFDRVNRQAADMNTRYRKELDELRAELPKHYPPHKGDVWRTRDGREWVFEGLRGYRGDTMELTTSLASYHDTYGMTGRAFSPSAFTDGTLTFVRSGKAAA